MPAYNKFENYMEDVLKGVHNLSTGAVKVALSNAAPAATDTVLANITEIANGGGYAAGGYALTTPVLSETGGIAKFDADDLTITATGAALATYRYLIIYNDTPTSPADPLIGWYDYGSALTLAQDESVTLRFDAANGMFTLT